MHAYVEYVRSLQLPAVRSVCVCAACVRCSDETLVHSSFKPVPGADFVISIELEGVTHRVYVRKRPGVDAFLKAVGEKVNLKNY